jgi:hypothetical protein
VITSRKNRFDFGGGSSDEDAGGNASSEEKRAKKKPRVEQPTFQVRAERLSLFPSLTASGSFSETAQSSKESTDWVEVSGLCAGVTLKRTK